MQNIFSSQLIRLRRKQRISQTSLSNKLYVSRQSISKWENGEAEPDIDKLINLSEIFNISLDGLILGKMTQKDLLLNVKNIYKAFNFSVLRGINLKIYGNERIAVLGSNGAGKSTLIKIIAGLINTDKGDIKYQCNPKKDLGLMPQNDNLINDLKVYELIKLTAIMHKSYSKNNINDLIKKLRLIKQKNMYVSNLSVGQKRRLSLLLSFIKPSKLLILDEPTVGMDLDSIGFLWKYLYHIQSTIMMITHDFNQIDKFFSRIILIKNGIIAKDVSIDLIHSHNQTVEQWYRINNKEDK